MNPSTINIIVIACLILLSMTFIDSIIILSIFYLGAGVISYTAALTASITTLKIT